MLPVSSEKLKGEFVFVAGDARVDEHSVLTSMHTLWMREHNRLCRVMMTDNTGTFAGMSADDMFNRARSVRPLLSPCCASSPWQRDVSPGQCL